MEFKDLSRDFRKYHSNSLNVALHLLTTPLALLSLLRIVAFGLGAAWVSAICALYCMALVPRLPGPMWVANTVCMATLSWAAINLVQWAPLTSTLMLAVGYFGQDLAHWMTGEATFQSTYIQKGLEGVIRDMAEHTFYLLPLVLDACLHLDQLPLFSWVVAYNKVLRTKLDGPDMKTHMATIVRYDPSVPSLPCSQPIQSYHA